MDLNYSASELAFRHEVRSWLWENIPADLREKVQFYEELTKEDLLRWHRILAAKGWIAPAWPIEWGGQDWTAVQHYIFDVEYALAGAPPIPPLARSMCGPILLKFGTEEQKRRFLPRIYSGDDFWCQGYSEPGAGSDLAALQCSAAREADHFVVNGQKTWTTLAHFADWIFCLVRTAPVTTKRQAGISFLLIDMTTPGVSVRPLELMDGGREVNEVFFDNVRVPVENMVHEENRGWEVAKHLLGHERLHNGRIGESRRELLKLKEFAAAIMKNGAPLTQDPRFRDKLSRIEIDLIALEVTNMRFVDQVRRTGKIGADVSILKIKGTEIQQAITELKLDAAGPMGHPTDGTFDPEDRATRAVARRHLNYRKTTIYAGSNEIQRNILAKASLGL